MAILQEELHFAIPGNFRTWTRRMKTADSKKLTCSELLGRIMEIPNTDVDLGIVDNKASSFECFKSQCVTQNSSKQIP
uniref:Uncharacterized protein n=1 Tax=Steinernema glaseri TaxID=37863 RepID=A0A1I8ADS3_9BILA